MKIVNYKSYDGSFYKLGFKILKRKEALGYLRSTYTAEAPLPIRLIDCTLDSDIWKFYEAVRLQNENGATPIVRIGIDERRCPFCNESKCVNNSKVASISFSQMDSQGDKFSYHRDINKCTNQKFMDNHFIIEYRSDNENFAKMMKRNQCPFCRAYGKTKISDITNFDSLLMKKLIKNLKGETKALLMRSKVLHFICHACNADTTFTGDSRGGIFRDLNSFY